MYLSHREIDILKCLADIDGTYYPETLGVTYIINAPWIAHIAWTLVSGFLDPVTKSKVILLGSDYKVKLPLLIESKYLPVEYGGTCQCPGGCLGVPGYMEGASMPAKIIYTEKELRCICVIADTPSPPTSTLNVDVEVDEDMNVEVASMSHDGNCISKDELVDDTYQVTEPRWVPEKGVTQCMHANCNHTFTVIRRKHHCRMCGIVVCSVCSRHRRHLPFPRKGRTDTVHRVCNTCTNKLDNTYKQPRSGYISRTSTSRNSLTPVATESHGTLNNVTNSQSPHTNTSHDTNSNIDIVSKDIAMNKLAMKYKIDGLQKMDIPVYTSSVRVNNSRGSGRGSYNGILMILVSIMVVTLCYVVREYRDCIDELLTLPLLQRILQTRTNGI